MIWMAFTGFQHLMMKIQTHDNWYGFHSFSFGIQNHSKAILGYELWIIQDFTPSLRDWLPVKSIWDRFIGITLLHSCYCHVYIYIYIYIYIWIYRIVTIYTWFTNYAFVVCSCYQASGFVLTLHRSKCKSENCAAFVDTNHDYGCGWTNSTMHQHINVLLFAVLWLVIG